MTSQLRHRLRRLALWRLAPWRLALRRLALPRPAPRRPDALSPFPRRRLGAQDGGQVAVLILGFSVISLLLVIGGVDVTAVQLARTRLMDAADGAALDAADSIDLPSTYSGGLGGTVPLTDATVATAAAGYLAGQPKPEGILGWGVGAGTGSPDGHTAIVRLQGTARIPIGGPILQSFGGSVGLDVESHARAVVR